MDSTNPAGKDTTTSAAMDKVEAGVESLFNALSGPLRVTAEVNKNYKKDGLKSYVYLIQKYNFTPTMPGPYYRKKQTHGPHLDNTRYGGLYNLCRHSMVGLDKPHHHHHRHHHKEKEGEASPASPSSVASSAVSYIKQRAASSNVKATVTAQDQQNDSLWLSPVTIGGQKMMLDFDSGSSDLWVMSSQQSSADQASCKQAGHSIYNPTASKPAATQQSGSTWQIEYGDGSTASGNVFTDSLVIGNITVTNQAIECAQQLDQSFIQGSGDGLLGLAMGAINTVQPKRVQTPMENMIAQSTIPSSAKLFTCYLSSYKDADEADQGQSFYTFGMIDQPTMKRCNATDFYWTALANQKIRGFWEFASTTYTINGTVTKRDATQQSGGNTAIADTGTTLCLVDDATCAAIYNAIPGSKYDSNYQAYVFPTNTPEAKLPQIGLDVGGKTFNIFKEALLFAETAPGWCYGGIQSRGDMTFDIWGDTFLKSVYACFDLGNKRFGCVQRTINSQNLTMPS